MKDVIVNSPALIVGVVVAVVALLGAFGAPLNDAQNQAVVGLVTAALALAGGLLVHRSTLTTGQVDTIVKSVQAVNTDPTVPAVDTTGGQGA